MRALISTGILATFVSTALAQTGPTVSNVTAAQRADGSRLVDIRYDLANQAPCAVWPVVSADGGALWNVPVLTLSGDFGPGVVPGTNRHIVWDAGADIPGVVRTFRARVYADDGNTLSNMVPVPGGSFPYQGNTSQQIFVASFYIDKYEVTNQRYAEFLNSADPNGTYWNPSIEITRSGTAPNVFYAPWPGRANYPVRYVSALDAEAYAAWLSTGSGRTYRLPTEQEWEKAAAWDPTLKEHWTYGFQSDSNISCAHCNYVQFNGNATPCVGSTTEIGHYNGTGGTNDAHSYYGCYDMTGNVSEWVRSGGDSIVRGGAFAYEFGTNAEWTTTYRFFRNAVERNPHIGFRLVLDLD